MGERHAESGLVTGTAAGIIMHLPLPGIVALAGFTGGYALVSDLDTRGSCCARSLGPLSEILACIIAFVSGGHRHLTHSLIGIAWLTALAELACRFRHDIGGRIGLMLLVTLAVASMLEALHLTDSLTADLIGLAVAGAVTWYGRSPQAPHRRPGSSSRCCGRRWSSSARGP
jgi:membrane-bound metal-dependent hydrolase YbcI (DUF457 family)